MKNILMAAVVVLISVGTVWGDGWALETITDANNGKGCSLVVDTQGNPHIAYLDETTKRDHVVYGKKEDGLWSYEMVAVDKIVDGTTAITTDPYDIPYVLYADDYIVYYADRKTGSWETEEVYEMMNVYHVPCLYSSFGPWPLGYGGVTFNAACGTSGTVLYYFIKTETEWVRNVLNPSFEMGAGANSLIIDGDDAVHVIFADLMSKKIRHAELVEDEWVFEDIDDGNDCCAYITADGKIHVSYVAIDNSALYYAVYDEGVWTIENVDKAKGRPGCSQICVNQDGTVFISYYNWAALNLHVATKNDATWSNKVVALGKWQGYPHAMAIGNEEYPQLLFYNARTKKLRYAVYDPTLDVELTRFDAKRSAAGVELGWAVADDEAVTGYNLYRENASGVREKANDALVTGTSPLSYLDDEAGAAGYDYWLEAVSTAGTRRMFGPASAPPAAKGRAFALHQNAPNPVRDFTTFSFDLTEASDVRLVIYDAAGRRVAVPAEGRYGAGPHAVNFHNDLPPGVYVYRLEAGENDAARKMVVTN
ncbi:MAG: T9SS type A sorting domain-containing protein [Candidatus Zixiibacteriota bacterium]|jgi:hypothetical protein